MTASIRLTTLLATVALATFSTAIRAASCDEYPFTDGMDIDQVPGGIRIISTGSAAVSFDDVAAIKDARDEATLEAKAGISKFLTETIKSDEAIQREVNETKTMQGDQKKAVRNEAVARVKSLRNSSQALLRGVVVLGDCYTKGREVRVSVGLKPETIEQAAGLASGIGQSVASQPTPTAGGTVSGTAGQSSGATGGASSGGQALQGRDGFSNTDRLKKF